MASVFQKIKELEGVTSFSKHEQLVQGVINAIDEKLIARGELLPSVNNMIHELGFARETIVKAYKELINRGIIESKNRLGYYVTNDDTNQHLRVALLLFAFDTFQETFYENLRNGLGDKIQLDVFFHHNNLLIFETIIANIKGKYGMYVVAPIPHEKIVPVLEQLPMNKFLMVDRFLKLKDKHSYIVQEFEESAYRVFSELSERIKKFEEFVFFFKPSTAEPSEVLSAFKRFVKDYGVKGTVRSEYVQGTIEPGKVYFTIHNLELWAMLKDTKLKKLKLGKDLGILSHNDDNVKEIIFDGITTFSVDFALMGRKAAEFVLKRSEVQEVLPTMLLRRNSL